MFAGTSFHTIHFRFNGVYRLTSFSTNRAKIRLGAAKERLVKVLRETLSFHKKGEQTSLWTSFQDFQREDLGIARNDFQKVVDCN